MHIDNTDLILLETVELATVTGGAARVDFNSIRQQAQQHCPATAQRYANVDPTKVTRGQAIQMGNACLAEMGPFKAAFARSTINEAIDRAFPRR